MDWLIRAPWLAFIVAAIFLILSRSAQRKMPTTAAISWLLYGVYEYLMHFRVLCSGECNIRVDLLLIYPFLLLLSIAAIVTGLKQRKQSSGS